MFGKKNKPIGIVIMDGVEYPIYEANKCSMKTGPNGEDLFFVTAKHHKYGTFSIDSCGKFLRFKK